MTLPRYAEYKDSGVSWLNQVPAHWEVRRLGFYFQERREKVSDKDFPALSVTKSGVVPQLETAAKTDDGDNRKRVVAGDFVINSRSDRKGSAGVAPLDGSVSLISTVLRPVGEIDGRFAHQLLRSAPFQEEFYRFGKGIVADLWSTNYSEMRNIALAMPPLREQKLIARFLDRETAKIDTLIAEQDKLITLLAEKRQATISHAVTRGLDPSTPVKDSGVQWLGSVPVQWKIVRIKRVVSSIEQGWSPQCESFPAVSTNEWGVLKVGCVNGGVFAPSENKRLPDELAPIPGYALKRGDLLVSRANTRELVGSAAVVPADFPNLLLCDKLYRVRLKSEECLPEFLAAFLGTAGARSQIEVDATGASSSMLNIGQSVVLDCWLTLPSVEEQGEIINFLSEELRRLELLAADAARAIALLKERRAALITAAVTGQIDVRDAVSTAEPEPEPERVRCAA